MNRGSVICALILALLVLNWDSEGASMVVPSEKAKTISTAMLLVKKGDTVRVQPGKYSELVFVTPGVVLLSEVPQKAILDAQGKGTVVTLGNGSMIEGFEIRNGTIGVFTTASGTAIIKCRIVRHQQTGILCVGNLPRIEDNTVVYNRGSGIQGWDVRSTAASVNHNTIAFNQNHGIALGGNSRVIIENNIVAFNEQFGLKPVDEAVRADLINNVFHQNAQFAGSLPADNYSYDPLFDNPHEMNFSLQRQSKCIGKGSDGQNIGARLVY